jgi:hypothetical protein
MKVAQRFREYEVPFVIDHIPAVNEVRQKWTMPYLKDHMGSSQRKVEQSNVGPGKTNHFMYNADAHRYSQSHPGYQPPTHIQSKSFSAWLKGAKQMQKELLAGEDMQQVNQDLPHQYMMTVSSHDPFIYDDLKGIFKKEESFWVVKPGEYRGIHCRFGMQGILAEAHFDGGRNFIAMLKGKKRYMLMHPEQCENIYLLPKSHPSGRHSDVDWSDPDFSKHPKFKQAMGLETILKEGQVLYVPSHWIHYIVSLDISVQCNCRSGTPTKQIETMKSCGFYNGSV